MSLPSASPRNLVSPPPRRGLTVVVVEGRDRGRSAVLVEGTRLRIGRAPGSAIELRDDLVSPSHLEVWLGEGGIGVRDLSQKSGTFIGPLRVVEALVPPATRVRIGRTVLAVGQPAPSTDVRERLAQEGFVYQSEEMANVAAELGRFAPFTMSILIEGETGTGKEVVARAVHALSMRNNGPFVFVDCGALPPNLVESELFGHERGAFTSAEGKRAGAFELAHGGTLFLDEIGELPRESQAALLGVLARQRFRRVGGSNEVQVDVRVVAATNRDLTEEIAAGAFRSDLFYRLATARLTLPPLRERPSDIDALVTHFFKELEGDGARVVTEEEAAELRAHAWPGNVRELRAVVERAVATGSLAIDRGRRGLVAASTPPTTTPPPTPSQPALSEPTTPRRPVDPNEPILSFRDARAQSQADFERIYLEQLITACGGNASEAARVARMDRPHLLRMLRRHNLR